MGEPQSQATAGGPDDPPAGRRAIAAWCLFDWANSVFPTVIVTFVFAAYFTRAIAETPEEGTWLWGVALSASALAVALLSPVLGAIADQGGPRKPWLLVTSLLCIAATAALWMVRPEPMSLWLVLILVALGNMAFEIGQVFYNAILPEIAPASRIGRVSGWAWGLGYAGGLVCLALSLVLFVQPDPALFGLDRDMAEHIRITGTRSQRWLDTRSGLGLHRRH